MNIRPEELYPGCKLLRRKGEMWLFACCAIQGSPGHYDGKIVAKYAVGEVSSAQLGRDVRKAIGEYWVIESEDDLPGNPVIEMANGKLSRFIKGTTHAFVVWDREAKTISVSGGYAATGIVEYLKDDSEFPDDVDAERIGTEVLAKLQEAERRAGA